MEIVRLPAGEMAREDTDCVHIERTPEGKFAINCSALLTCGDGDGAESVALIGSEPYDSFESAEAAGLAWASDQCVDVLYVSTSADAGPNQ